MHHEAPAHSRLRAHPGCPSLARLNIEIFSQRRLIEGTPKDARTHIHTHTNKDINTRPSQGASCIVSCANYQQSFYGRRHLLCSWPRPHCRWVWTASGAAVVLTSCSPADCLAEAPLQTKPSTWFAALSAPGVRNVCLFFNDVRRPSEPSRFFELSPWSVWFPRVKIKKKY